MTEKAPTKQTYDADSYANVLPDKSVHQHSDRIYHQPGFTYDDVAQVGALPGTWAGDHSLDVGGNVGLPARRPLCRLQRGCVLGWGYRPVHWARAQR